MRLVLDTNVVVAGLVAQGLCHELISEHLPRHEGVLSEELWDELVRTLREKFGLEPGQMPFLDLYRRHATWVEPVALEHPVSRDPSDDPVLATAVAGGAEALVSGDDDLLVLGSFERVQILSPREFLERVARG